MNGAHFGLYVHIPFCRTRCIYCDFVSNALAGPVPDAFIEVLCREMAAFSFPGSAQSVFFGGGTPSLLSCTQLERMVNVLQTHAGLCAAEITLEANPDDVTADKARAWRALGINRVSLGVQSFNDDALRFLARRHDSRQARAAAAVIAEVFDNWNMDLIYGAPPMHAWHDTLNIALKHAPPHIAAYCLTYEPGTALARRNQPAFDDDALLDFYRHAEEMLCAYDHYEISNFARPGFQCRHNLLYWRNECYVGFGPGAYSYVGNMRMRNVSRLEEYLAHPDRKAEALELSVYEQQLETLIQHMRLEEGIADEAFQARFGVSFMDVFGDAIRTLSGRGLVCHDAGRLRPTRQGFYLNNEIGLALVGAHPEGVDFPMGISNIRQQRQCDGCTSGTNALLDDTGCIPHDGA